MDIYSAEIQVKKLLNYVQGLSDSKSRMYQKSKDRLKELANTCTQVVSVISELLQDEALANNDNNTSDEFGGSDTTDYISVLDSMEVSISELRQFINPHGGLHVLRPVSTATSNDKKQVMYDYKVCLHNLSTSTCCVQEADDCSKLIWDWFSARYLEGPENFRYNTKKIPYWIRDIVIMYGYHVDQNSTGVFKTSFHKWINDISPDNNYVVPYEIYTFEKNPNPKMLTLTSAVLWDILLDSGLRDLCNKQYFEEDMIYSMIGSLNSEIMNPYTNYQYDSSILQKCKLTVKEGDEK